MDVADKYARFARALRECEAVFAQDGTCMLNGASLYVKCSRGDVFLVPLTAISLTDHESNKFPCRSCARRGLDVKTDATHIENAVVTFAEERLCIKLQLVRECIPRKNSKAHSVVYAPRGTIMTGAADEKILLAVCIGEQRCPCDATRCLLLPCTDSPHELLKAWLRFA